MESKPIGSNIPIPKSFLVKNKNQFLYALKSLGFPKNPVCFKPSKSISSGGFQFISFFMVENRIVTAYRKYAKNYDFAVKLYRLLGIKIRKYRKLAVDSLELTKGDTVIELGCVTGFNFSLVLNAISPEGKLIGVDISDKMLDQARKRVKIDYFDFMFRGIREIFPNLS